MTVVGVAAAGFRGVDVGEVPAVWIPASMSADAVPGFNEMLDHRMRWMQILGRLHDGLSAEQAQAALQRAIPIAAEPAAALPLISHRVTRAGVEEYRPE
jgi:hypothetical protein